MRRLAAAAPALAFAAALALVPLAARAQWQGPEPGTPGSRESAPAPPRPPDAAEPTLPGERFTRHDRDLVAGYQLAEYGPGRCPPGLKKKKRECLPGGRSMRRYRVGERLSPAVALAPLPLDLARRLGPPPIGYRYGLVDGDVLKVASDTLRVVDAIVAAPRQ